MRSGFRACTRWDKTTRTPQSNQRFTICQYCQHWVNRYQDPRNLYADDGHGTCKCTCHERFRDEYSANGPRLVDTTEPSTRGTDRETDQASSEEATAT